MVSVGINISTKINIFIQHKALTQKNINHALWDKTHTQATVFPGDWALLLLFYSSDGSSSLV